MIDAVAQWVMQDPLKNVLLIFGRRGLLTALVTWGSMWANRRRIRVRVLSENYSLRVTPTIDVELRLEVTNVGEKPTSLEPEIMVRAVTPERVLTSFVLPIQEPNRQLPPHAQKSF